MTKYAEILNNIWLMENVPASFENSLNNETNEQKTWKEYCTDTVGNFNGCTRQGKTFVRFKINGSKDIELGDYTSDKLRFITEREFLVWKGNHYLIHLFTNCPLDTNPENIHWQAELNVGLEPKPYQWGTILYKTFYYGDLPIIRKEYSCTRENRLKINKTKKFYWYKADGTSECLKTQIKPITNKSLQVNDLIKETNYAIDGAYAFTVGTPLQAAAEAYFEYRREAERISRRTGDESFKNQIASEAIINNAVLQEDINYNALISFLFIPYNTSHLTHEHNLGDNPTIQDALVSYLTLE